MQQASRRGFVCWRCSLAQPSAHLRAIGSRPASVSPAALASALQRTKDYGTVARSGSAAARKPDIWDSSRLARVHSKKGSIRDELRAWELANPGEAHEMLNDAPAEGMPSNSGTRPSSQSWVEVDLSAPLFEGDELGDLRGENPVLHPGTLVELSSPGSRRPLVAISLGTFQGVDSFYTSSGQWLVGPGARTLFVLNDFVKPKDLEPVLAELPPRDVPAEQLSALRELGHGPSRKTGAFLLKKMMNFIADAEEVYKKHASTFDDASKFVKTPEFAPGKEGQPTTPNWMPSHTHQYLTLHEIALLLFPPAFENGPEASRKAGKKSESPFSPVTYYAIHRSLMQNYTFFRPAKQIGHARSYLFEVSPLSDYYNITYVEACLHKYQFGLPTDQHHATMRGFIDKARRAVDSSRAVRDCTPNGTLGPQRGALPTSPEWTRDEARILNFMMSWAGYQKFPLHSRYNSLGSAILRLIGRYGEEYMLSTTTGWTFLQEVSWIPAWENAARYTNRLPGVEVLCGGGYYRNIKEHIRQQQIKGVPMTDSLALLPDVFEPSGPEDVPGANVLPRKTWEGLTAWAIDSASTEDIDDAVSIEPTSAPDQHWVHIHVADPASRIKPDSGIAAWAELVPSTLYLSGSYERMMPGFVGSKEFSLGPGRPCLTFSALVDKDGLVLENKITPARLSDTVFMTPEDAASATGESKGDESPAGAGRSSLSVGSMPEPAPPTRQMTGPQDLTEKQRQELSLLREVVKRVQAHRAEKAIIPYFEPRPGSKTSLDHDESHKSYVDATQAWSAEAWAGPRAQPSLGEQSGTQPDHWHRQPAIEVGYEQRVGTDLVENAMKLAGEVAAKWCHDRGIPIPYRTQRHGAQNADALLQYSREVIKPLLQAGEKPTDGQWRILQSLIGPDELTTKPGPHLWIGTDMYTKATSPLRRFSDLLVHWQVEAALLEEARTGRSLVGSDKNSNAGFLPFTREALDRKLPMLRVRERQARALTAGDGTDHWILLAMLRAWRFGEGSLPETFEFTVGAVRKGMSLSLAGRIDWFNRPAVVRIEDQPEGGDGNAAAVPLRSLAPGAVLRVKIVDINVHSRQIFLQIIEKIRDAPEPAAAAAPTPSA